MNADLPSSSSKPEATDRNSAFHWSPLMILMGLTVLWVFVGSLGVLQQLISGEMDWRTSAQFACLDWGPWLFISPLVIWFSARVQVSGRNWARTIPLHLLAGLVAVYLHTSIAEGILNTGWFPPPWRPHHEDSAAPKKDSPESAPHGDRPPEPPTVVRYVRLRLSAPIYFFLVAAAHAVVYHRRGLERERRALAAEALLSEARLTALQTQLQPHFLFNTLNTVSSLVYSNPAAADEMICSLSRLLRQVLEYSGRSHVPLSEEIAFVEAYLRIQRIRFSDRLKVVMSIEPGLGALPVPTLILQPLVENAILHGITPNAAAGLLEISIRRAENVCVIEVTDSGLAASGLQTRADGSLVVSERVGLRNTRERLEALYGGSASFGLFPSPSGGICSRLRLPFKGCAGPLLSNQN